MPDQSPEPSPAEQLNAAMKRGDLDQIRHWLIAGASLTIKVAQGGGGNASALNHWVAHGDVALWPVLRAHATPVINHEPRNSFTPLAVAAKNNRVDMMPLLLAAGADLNGNRDGKNPLMCAVRYNAPEALDFLLEQGADVHVRTSTQDTLLHLAVEKNRDHLWPVLVRTGLDADARNQDGHTAQALINEGDAGVRAARHVAWENCLLRDVVERTVHDLPSSEKPRL